MSPEQRKHWHARAEREAVRIDGGLGQLALAAVMATPAGPARTVEARRWAQRADELGLEHVVFVVHSDWTDEHIAAHAELHVALAEHGL